MVKTLIVLLELKPKARPDKNPKVSQLNCSTTLPTNIIARGDDPPLHEITKKSEYKPNITNPAKANQRAPTLKFLLTRPNPITSPIVVPIEGESGIYVRLSSSFTQICILYSKIFPPCFLFGFN